MGRNGARPFHGKEDPFGRPWLGHFLKFIRKN